MAQTATEQQYIEKQHEEFAELHKRLGCYGCRYADKDQLGKWACCTKAGQLGKWNADGSCPSRKQ